MTTNYYVRFAPLILIAANLFFVGSFSLAKLLTLQTAVPVIMMFRFLAGIIYLTPYILLKKHNINITSWPMLIFRVFCGVSAMTSLFFAFKFGDIGKGTLIFELSIIWTLIFELIFFRKKPHIISLLTIPFVFLGVIFVLNPLGFLDFSKGDLFAFLGSIFNAGVYISLKKLRDNHDTVTVVFWTYLLSFLIIVLPAAPSLAVLNPTTMGLLLIMCTIGFGGQMCMVLGFKYATAGISSLFMISIIPLTTLSGILFFNEQYTSQMMLGILLVFGALTVISKYR